MRIGVTLGDPRGIGPEVAAVALSKLAKNPGAVFVVLGPASAMPTSLAAADRVTLAPADDPGGAWDDAAAGAASVAAVEQGVALALAGELDGLVTAPISKAAVAAAGFPWPGHTELLRDRTGADDVTMIMSAEDTPLGGPLRIALLTVHVPLREAADLITVDLVERRSRIAARALRDWWGIERPRLAFAGVNPHASEGGLFGDEEAMVLEPAMSRLRGDPGMDVVGLFPADSVFRRCISGDVDLVITPVHDVGLAVLKTVAPENGINVTAGLPFPRTSPDHGTAFDIARTGRADARSMTAAVSACIRFAENAARAPTEESTSA